MIKHYLEVLSDAIRSNWNEIALADYRSLTRYTYGDMADQMANLADIYKQLKIKRVRISLSAEITVPIGQ